MASGEPFLTRVVLKNYKSIAACDVRLGRLTFFVGPNGAGKSNFLDAVRFVADALKTTLDHAMRDRGGVSEVRRRSGGHPTHFGVRVEFLLPDGSEGWYAFEVGARRGGDFSVQREECFLRSTVFGGTDAFFRVTDGVVEATTAAVSLPAFADRLYLVTASGLPEFRPVFDGLSSMGFYSLNPDSIKELQAPDAGHLLQRDGGNIASVLGRLAAEDPVRKERIEEYLASIVPGLHGVDRLSIGPKESLEFRQTVPGAQHPWRFPALNMSDGTLRAFGILVALFQRGIPFVGIEEPETALHPAAAGVVLDALHEASRYTQIAVTSHSPDLLDSPEIDVNSILAVTSREGATVIGRIDEADRTALRERLYTAGELLRLNQLAPDRDDSVNPDQLALFSPV